MRTPADPRFAKPGWPWPQADNTPQHPGCKRNAPELLTAPDEDLRDDSLLSFYEAIETASHNMLDAARPGDWDTVVKLEGACAVLIARPSMLRKTAPLGADELALKSRIMHRILANDAEVRNLAEPWIQDLSRMVGGRPTHVKCTEPTEPALSAVKGSHANLDDYRITSAVEIQALLKQLLESNTLVTLGGRRAPTTPPCC